MNNSVMIFGAAGNFGGKIASSLAKAGISLILVGRTEKNLNELKSKIEAINSKISVAIVAVSDIETTLTDHLKFFKPFIVINTCGPFQLIDCSVAKSCIIQKTHYIDLADGRQYVENFTSLDELAIANDCIAISGASTVPCLSSAVLEHYKDQFNEFESLKYGIAPGQRADRGLSTVRGVLSYTGKVLKPYVGSDISYGWQDIYRQKYPVIGTRLMANCDIPDLDLLPKFYNLKSIKFSGSIENSIVHLGLWFLSWLVRLKIIENLEKYSALLLKLSHIFDPFGTSDGGMHMIISGKDKNNLPKTVKWFIIAKNGHGPHIPSIPAIILTKKIIQGNFLIRGAKACVGLVSLEEYISELKCYDIEVYEQS